MKISYLVVLFVVFSVLTSIISFAAGSFNVGVSPGTLDLGNLEAGSTKLVDFYIITPSEEALLVKLEAEKSNLDFFSRPSYKDFIYNYSEEDATPWVKVINNPVEIRPSNETLRITGGLIRGKEQISFLIDIPKNAEPGYHMLYIKPIPSASSETVGVIGSRVVAITSIGIIFNVSGNAIRKGVILDTETGKYVDDELEIKTYFQNTGTNTISASATQRIYNKDGEVIKELSSITEYVKPKEIKTLRTSLPTTGLSLGDYDVYTIVDYTTGKAEKSSIIKLTTPPPTSLAAKVEKNETFIILIIVVIVVIITAIIIYRRIQ
jgi:hypothetical protein